MLPAVSKRALASPHPRVHAGHKGRGGMKLYRINKLTKPGGAVVKKKHVLAATDRQAVQDARESDDCPVCDVLRDGKKVGEVY